MISSVTTDTQVAVNSNIRSLHVIRGIAALIVVVYHAKFVLWSGGSLYTQEFPLKTFLDYAVFGIDMLSSCGLQCVYAFFILSGFVIHHSFRNSDKNLSHFYVIRVIRIYLPYLFSVALSVITISVVAKLNPTVFVDGIREYNSRLLVAYHDINIVMFLKSLLFVQAKEYPGFNHVYWSLFHEAIFYLCYPIYFFLGYKKRAALLFALAFLGVFFKMEILYFQVYFLIGIFLNDFYLSGQKIFVSKKTNAWIYLGLIFVGFVITNLLVHVKISYLADFASLVTTLVAFDYIIIHGIKKNKWLATLADISFTLYLNHVIVLMICYALFNIYLNKLIFFERYPYYISIIVAIFVCYIIYEITEKPSLVLIKKVKAKWN